MNDIIVKYHIVHYRYGDVFWTMMDPVPLDPDLVARFKDKTMAIVGYETDQVHKSVNSSLRVELMLGLTLQVFKGENGEADQSVPITWAYNHHYCAFLASSYTKMTQVPVGIYPSGR